MRQSRRSKAIPLLLDLLLSFGQLCFPMTRCLQPIRIKNRRVRSMILAIVCAGLLTGQVTLARAADEDSDGQIVLAALTTSVPGTHNGHREVLFGATEQRYTDLSAFTKWTGVLSRFKKEFPKQMDRPEVQDWIKFLSGLKNASKQEKIEAVNEYLNKRPFISDQNNYGVADKWATPMEFLARGGDCEDYAIAKYISLRALGFSQSDLRLAIVYDYVMRMPHALLIAYNEDKVNVLDNQNPDVVDASDITRYKPIYAISQAAWWRY